MTTKEMTNKIIDLRNEAYDLEEKISRGVRNYINAVYGMASCNDAASDHLVGIACKEECGWNYDKKNNLICISFSTFRNKWGDLSDSPTEVYVDPSVIDKYYNV